MLKFLEIEDRISGRKYTHSNPKKNLLIKMNLPMMKRNGEFELIKHDLEQAGFNVFMIGDTNKYCYLQVLGQSLPKPFQIDIINKVSKNWEVLYPETLKQMGYDFLP